MGAMIREDRFGVATITISPAQVAAATTAEQTFTCLGLKPGDVVVAVKPTHNAGVMPIHARASAADTIAITFVNPTAGALTPTASEAWLVHWFRAEKTTASVGA